MAYFKPATDWEQERRSATPEKFVDTLEKLITKNNQFFKGHYAEPYYETDFINIQVANNMKRVYVYIPNRRKEVFLLQMDFDEPINTVYINHEGDLIDYYSRALCISNFLDAAEEAAELNVKDLATRLEAKLPRKLFALKGRLEVLGPGSIIKGRALHDDEFSLSFTLYTQYAAREMHRELLGHAQKGGMSAANSQVGFDEMTGLEFERYCAELLRINGFTEVEITKGSGDQGIDIVASKDYVKYGFQCKCYSSAIGNKAIQEAHAGKAFYGCHVAVVITNSRFTSAAKSLAEQVGVVLWDRDILLSLSARTDAHGSHAEPKVAHESQPELTAALPANETLDDRLADQMSVVREVVDTVREMAIRANHRDGRDKVLGIEDKDIKANFDLEILQYMLWVITASGLPSEKDAQAVNLILGKPFNSNILNSFLASEGFFPVDYKRGKPFVITRMVQSLHAHGNDRAGSMVLKLFVKTGELVARIEPSGYQARKRRADDYCSSLSVHLSI